MESEKLIRPPKKTVDEWLNEVDYSKDKYYKPTKFSIDFVNFIKLVNGSDGEENKTPIIHYRMLDNIASGKKNTLNMIFRGAAKTTLFAEYLILYLAVYGKLPQFGEVDLAIYVSDSIDNGVKNLRKNLEYRYDNSEFLKQLIPRTKFTDIRWEFENADGKVLIVKGYGAKTGVRGTKELGKRPQLAILDDLVSDEDARSPTVISTIEDTVYKAIDHALHPTRRKIIWNGTPFNKNDPLYKAAESGAWWVSVYPVCNEFPCKKEEFVGAWEDRFPYEYVRDMYEKAKAAGKVDAFYQELMLRIISEDERLVQDEDLRWFRTKEVLHNRHAYNFYITTDFATSEKSSSDYSVISVWAYNSNKDWMLVDGICKRQLMDKNIDDLFRLVSEYKPQQVGIEVSGQQAGFISWIQNEMVNRNIYFSLASENNSGRPGLRPIKSKLERFNIVLPWFKTGKIWLPEDKKDTPLIVELLEELKYATPKGFRSKHDDVLDTISQLASLTPWEPSIEDLNRNEGDRYWEDDIDLNDEGSPMDAYVV